MGNLSRFLPVLLVVIGSAVSGPAARAESDGELMKTFAYCAGRLSAEMEHAWLFGGDAADRIAQRREATLALLAAVAGDPDTGPALDYRIHAKHAHARLLRDATFQSDPERAERARRLAATRIRACSSFLLG